MYSHQANRDGIFPSPQKVPSSFPFNLYPSLRDNHCSAFYHHTLVWPVLLCPLWNSFIEIHKIKFTHCKDTIQQFSVNLWSGATITMTRFSIFTNSKSCLRPICTPHTQPNTITDLLSVNRFVFSGKMVYVESYNMSFPHLAFFT